MKEKILWIGLTVVIISWIGNYLYFFSKQLDQPIFLDHYYEAYVQDDMYLTFYYLSNKTDPFEVIFASINGVEAYPVSDDEFMMWSSNTPQFEQEFNHQYLKSVRLEIPEMNLPIEKGSKDVWSFEEINVTFSDSQTVTADIGKVNVYGRLQHDGVFDTRVSSSSNQHFSEESMATIKPLTVEAITVPFSEEISEDVFVKVNLDQENLSQLDAIKQGGDVPSWYEEEQVLDWNELEGVSIKENVFPFHLDQNDWIQLSMLFNPRRKSYFEFGIEILGTTDDGKPFMSKSPIIDHPYLTQNDINEIIEEKQGGSAQ